MRRIRLVIADRQPIVLQGISSVLAAQHEFMIVAACSDGASCIEAVRLLGPDLVLLDAAMPDVDAAQVLALANATGLATRVVLFTGTATDRELPAPTAGDAHTVLSKDATPEMLLETLRRVAQVQGLLPPTGQGLPSAEEKSLTQLTDRERQIMRLVSEGLTNKEIGRRLNITDGTIKVHLHHIFQKLDITNRTALATLAISRDELRAAAHEPDPLNPSPPEPASSDGEPDSATGGPAR